MREFFKLFKEVIDLGHGGVYEMNLTIHSNEQGTSLFVIDRGSRALLYKELEVSIEKEGFFGIPVSQFKTVNLDKCEIDFKNLTLTNGNVKIKFKPLTDKNINVSTHQRFLKYIYLDKLLEYPKINVELNEAREWFKYLSKRTVVLSKQGSLLYNNFNFIDGMDISIDCQVKDVPCDLEFYSGKYLFALKEAEVIEILNEEVSDTYILRDNSTGTSFVTLAHHIKS